MPNLNDIVQDNINNRPSGATSGAVNYVSPSYTINYISEWKKIIVTRNNGPVNQKLKIDNRIKDEYYFQIVSRNNQFVYIDDNFEYEFIGSFIDAKNQMHVVFYSDTYTITNNNLIKFKVNTFTSEYLYNIKRPKEIDLTIKKKSINEETIILRDSGIAYPCPAEPGQEPTPVVAGRGLQLNGYVMSLQNPVSGAFGAGRNLNFHEGWPNSPSFGFGQNLYCDGNQLVIGRYNVENSDAAFIIGNGNIDERNNIFTVAYYNGNVSGGTFYSNGVQLATVNDISGSTSYTAGEGISISDQNVISLTATIPSSVYELDGSSNYVCKLNLLSPISWATNTSESGITYTLGVDYNSLHNDGFAYTSAIPTSASQLDGISAYYKNIRATSPLKIDTYSYGDQSSGKDMQMWIDTNTLSQILKESYGFAVTGQIPVDYLSSLNTATDDWLALYPQENHKCRIDFNFNNLSTYAQTSAIPTSTSQLTNDTNYINSLVGTNGINCAFNDVAGANPYDRSWVIELTETIPTSTSQLFNDSGYITTSNKLKVYTYPSTYGSIGIALDYREDCDVISCAAADNNGVVTIFPCDHDSLSGLENGDVVTFENWIQTAGTSFIIQSNGGYNIYAVGDIPSGLTANSTKVFVRRIIKQNNTTTEYISFAYEF